LKLKLRTLPLDQYSPDLSKGLEQPTGKGKRPPSFRHRISRCARASICPSESPGWFVSSLSSRHVCSSRSFSLIVGKSAHGPYVVRNDLRMQHEFTRRISIGL